MRVLSGVLAVFLAFALALPASAAPAVFHGSVDATVTGGYVLTGACGAGSISTGQICTTSGAPANACAIGATAVDSTAGNEYRCTATNTWTKVVLSGGTFGAITVSGITDTTATANSCVATGASKQFVYGGTACTGAQTGTANTFTATQTVNAFLKVQVNGTGNGQDHAFNFNNVGATITVPGAIGTIASYLPNINTSCPSSQPVAEYWHGASGTNTTNLGGYQVFATKPDGSCSIVEALVLDPQQHIFMPNDTAQFRQNTPGACTAGTSCMTITWTFTKPFLNTDGVTAQAPRCFAGGVYDESDSTQLWMAQLKGPPTSTSVTYNIAPMVNIAAAHTLDVYLMCHDQAY